MGRMGPAFLAYPNFAAYTEWNNSLIYSTTAGYLATRIAGAPPMQRPAAPVAQLPFNELRELQQLLVRAGFNVGKIDGVMGQQSRSAVKAMQIKYGLPADSWPTAELLARMRGPRAAPAASRVIARGIAKPHICKQVNVPSTRKEHPMSFYDATVPAFLQILGSLPGLLTKAEAHCKAKNIQPEVLLGARLYPDMLPFTSQIQLVSDFAAKSCARLTNSEVPTTPDTEKSFDELKAAACKDHRLCEDVQAGAVRRRREPRGHLSRRARQDHDAEGPAVPQQFRLPEFLLPRRDRPRHPAPQRRGNRQARFSGREFSRFQPAW